MSGDRAEQVRLPAGGMDDANRWECCAHCDDPCDTPGAHEEPCMLCQDGPR